MKWSLLSLIWCVMHVGYSQNPIDSLKNLIETTPDLTKRIDLHAELGRLYFEKTNFVGAQQQFYASLKHAEQLQDTMRMASNYNNISAVFMETNQLTYAKYYAGKSILYFHSQNDYEGLADAYNSLANVYYMDYQDSLSVVNFKRSLKYRHLAGDSIGIFTGYKNLGSTYFEMQDTALGTEYIKKSMHYLPKNSNVETKFKGYLTLAEIYAYSSKLDTAKRYLDTCAKLLPEVKAYHKIDDYYYALHFYHKKLNNFPEALKNYELYAQYKDSVLNQASSYQLLELKTQYETEKKEQIIETQNKEIKTERKLKFLYMLLAILIVSIAVLIIGAMIRRHQFKTKQIIQQQQTNALKQVLEAEENQKATIARDLHDGVVQSLSALALTIQNRSTNINEEQVVRQAQEITDEIRGLAYQMMPVSLQKLGLIKAVEDLVQQSCKASQFTFDFNSLGINRRLPESIEIHVFRIVQELIQNTRKHSNGNHVSVLFQLKDDVLQFTYEDNGSGYNVEKHSGSIGLSSIQSRVWLLKGTIQWPSVDTTSSVFIKIPLSNP